MNICYSGGAQGADTIFGEEAEDIGHTVIHYRPNIVKQPNFPYQEAHNALLLANKTLKRTYPTSKKSIDNLLLRNYLQIKDSNRIYAITALDENLLPLGGTAWAVIMGINKGIEEIYLFDSIKNKWFEFSGIRFQETNDIPVPSGKYTGIGSRILTDNAIKEIKKLYLPVKI